MKFGNEFWIILFREYISPKLFAMCRLCALSLANRAGNNRSVGSKLTAKVHGCRLQAEGLAHVSGVAAVNGTPT